MRILIVSHGFPPSEKAGTEWHSYILAKELLKKHEIYVFSRISRSGKPESRYLEYQENIDGIPVRRIETREGWIACATYEETYIDDRVALSFSKVIEEFKPDIIHIQHLLGLGFSLIEIAIKRKIPILLYIHDFYLLCFRTHLFKPDGNICLGPKYQKYCADCISEFNSSLNEKDRYEVGLKKYNYVRDLLCKVDKIIAPSNFVKKTIIDNFKFKSKKITVLPLGLDLEFKKKFSKRISNKFRFGYIGTIFAHKGIHILIKAFKDLNIKDVELKIYGYGDKTYLDELQKEIAPNMTFMGAYDHSEIADVLSYIDVLVAPSLCHESYSFTIREALAAGIPVIVSDLQAQKEAIIEGYNGFHFKTGDINDLKIKMRNIVSDTKLYTELSCNARKSHILSIKEQTENLEKLYLKSINRARKKKLFLTIKIAVGRSLFNLLMRIRNSYRVLKI